MKILKLILITLLTILCTVSSYSQDLKVKKKKGKYGFILNKKKITDFKYDEVNKKYKGNYEVKNNGKWGIVDKNGMESVPCKYDTLLSSWSKNIIAVLNGKYGVVDISDNIIVDFKYQEIDYSVDSTTLVKLDNKWGLLTNDKIDFSQDKVIFKSPEKMPLFVQCENFKENFKTEKDCADRRLLEFVYGRIKYPKEARDFGVEGTIVISFIVAKDGSIENPKIIRDIGANCGNAGIEVVNMMNKWIPGYQDGHPVATQFNLPIKFRLE